MDRQPFYCHVIRIQMLLKICKPVYMADAILIANAHLTAGDQREQVPKRLFVYCTYQS